MASDIKYPAKRARRTAAIIKVTAAVFFLPDLKYSIPFQIATAIRSTDETGKVIFLDTIFKDTEKKNYHYGYT